MSFELILPFFPGPVQALLLEQKVSDVMINNGQVFADQDGILRQIPGVSIDPDALQAGVENIARRLGKDIDQKRPILDARLPDGSRVAVVGPPASVNGLTVTIRKFNRWYSLMDLLAADTVRLDQAEALRRAVHNRRNILIAGGTGSGKTTLAKALLDEAKPTDRLLVIENPAELAIGHPNTIRWETSEQTDGRRLLAAALRMRPDRIIFGEVRDHAAYDLLQAMNTGHSGTLSTIHADSASSALYRFANLALSAQANLTPSFLRAEVAAAIHLVVYIRRQEDGRRRVEEILSVDGYSVREECFLTTPIQEHVYA